MIDYSENISYMIVDNIEKNELSKMVVGLKKLEGINNLIITDEHEVIIEYNVFRLSKESLDKVIGENEYPLRKKNNHTGLFKHFIDNLIKDNRAAFGHNTPCCCHSKQ